VAAEVSDEVRVMWEEKIKVTFPAGYSLKKKRSRRFFQMERDIIQ